MAEEKPRILQSTRDIVLSLTVIIVVMGLLVGFTGMCTFNRGEPENGPVREVDPHTFYQLEANTATFPLRDPGDIPDWTPNSARRIDIDGYTSPTVGWVVGSDSYVQLTQTAASLEVIADYFKRTAGETYEITGDFGTREVTIYPAEDADERDYYVLDDADVRLVVSGAATRAQFNEIFTRTLDAEVLNP